MTENVPKDGIHLDDAKSHERYFREHYQPLCYFASNLLHDDEASEDVVQNVFYQIISKQLSFESEQHMRSYLYVAVRNACINTIRANKKLKTVSLSDDAEDRPSVGDIADTTPEDLERLEQQTLLLQQLSTYIEELPPRYKEIFVLSFVKEMKNGEVAEALGISINTVKVVKQKVKNRLKERTTSFLSDIRVILLFLFA